MLYFLKAHFIVTTSILNSNGVKGKYPNLLPEVLERYKLFIDKGFEAS